MRPADVLELVRDYFSGGSHLTEAQEGGLLSILQALGERAPIVAVTTSRAVVSADEGVILEVDPDGGTVEIQLPPDLPIGFFVQIRQVTAGTVEIVSTGGATIDAVSTAAIPLTLTEQWAVASAEVRATDSWLVTGQLA